MKIWQKILISILLIFEMFFIPSCLYLFNKNFNLTLQESVESAKNSEQRLSSFLKSNVQTLKPKHYGDGYFIFNTEDISKKDIETMIDKDLMDFHEENIFFEVIDEENRIITSNLNVPLPKDRPELDNLDDNINQIIRDIGENTYVVIAEKIELNDNTYKLSYIKDISEIYVNRDYMINLLIKLNLIVVVILAVISIVISRFLVKPIGELIDSTKVISSGNFCERVKYSSHDEVGMLAENFNDMAEVVEEKINELAKASNDKQRFIDNLAHELRTPLTSIIGYADFLRRNEMEREVLQESLGFIYDAGKRMEKLSFTLMDLIILRKKDFEMKTENIKMIFKEVKENLKYKLRDKNINLFVECEYIEVKVNKYLVVILISNFIDNAIKASRENGKIYLRSYKRESSVIVEIEDEGVGIPKEDLNKVFEPFFMVDKSRERANGGVGLGLSLCRNIVEIHKGSVSIDSILGKGTKVKVEFY